MPHKFINFWNKTARRILLIIGKNVVHDISLLRGTGFAGQFNRKE